MSETYVGTFYCGSKVLKTVPIDQETHDHLVEVGSYIYHGHEIVGLQNLRRWMKDNTPDGATFFRLTTSQDKMVVEIPDISIYRDEALDEALRW